MDNIAHTDTTKNNRNSNTPTKMLKWTVNKTAVATTQADNTTMSIFVDNEQPLMASARRSLGAPRHTKPKSRDMARKSLGSAVATRKLLRAQNKENFIMVSPHANLMRNSPTTSTPHPKTEFAFREIGNLTPNNTSAQTTPLRKAYLPPSPSPQQTASAAPNTSANNTLAAAPRQRLFAATLPTLDVEYSPACYVERPAQTRSPLPVHGITVQNTIFGTARYFGGADGAQPLPATKKAKLTPELTPLSFQLSKLRFSQVSLHQCGLEGVDDGEPTAATVAVDDDAMSSRSLDDTALEKMIDEILESTRKVRKCARHNVRLPQCPVTTTTTNTTSTNDVPIRSKMVDAELTIILNSGREREVRTPDSTCDVSTVTATTPLVSDEQCQLRRQRVVRRKHTTKGKKAVAVSAASPERTLNMDMLARMNTPQDQQTMMHIIPPSTATTSTTTTPPGIGTDDVLDSSTPSDAQMQDAQITRRCLRYPDSPDSMEDSLEKRQSVASSSASTTSSMRCSSSSKLMATVFGTLDVTVAVQAHQVHVHVLRCKDLLRTNGGPINAYVKVALLTSAQHSDTGFQRTAVQRNSAEPIFEHRFVFDGVGELADRVQLSVWHRDREYKRSEFLGCMSFAVHSLNASPIAGTYRLQSQSNLSHPTAPIVLQAQPLTASQDMTAANNGAISLSKKALYQRDADELLYLRYLQLNDDATHSGGRTSCTLSKRLTSSGPTGFGFSVVWTHPPRVEKVEANLSADRAGLLPGDFLAFVGEHNVVTMPEVDVLNLIRSQGQTLDIEVFRKPAPSAAKRPLYEDMEERQRTKVARVEFSQDVGCGIIV